MVLTDVPLGSWTAAAVLDVLEEKTGSRAMRRAERMPQSRWVWLERREQRLPVWPIGPRSVAVNLAASVWRTAYSTPPPRPVTSHRYAFGGLTHDAPGGDLLYSA